MSPDRRAPWWYSGDDEQPGPAEVPDAGQVPEPAASTAPAAPAEPDEPTEPAAEEGTPSMDWMALVVGAARMVDWATERVMAPHAEHVNPAEHPDCMVCRTVTLIGDPVGLMTADPRPPEDAGPATADEDRDAPGPALVAREGAEPIRWIPIVESRD